jgi:hypothetical protein
MPLNMPIKKARNNNMDGISREEATNISANQALEMQHRIEQKIATVGCQTLVGCGKTKEIENYLNGKLKSDLNDIRVIFDKMIKDISGLKNLMQFDEKDTGNRLKAAEKAVVDSEKIAKDSLFYVRANVFVTAITFLGILITIIFGYLTFLKKDSTGSDKQDRMIQALEEKIKQDRDNQNQTIGMMDKLYKRLEK